METGLYVLMVFSTGLLLLGFTFLVLGWKEVFRGKNALVTFSEDLGLRGWARYRQAIRVSAVVVTSHQLRSRGPAATGDQ